MNIHSLLEISVLICPMLKRTLERHLRWKPLISYHFCLFSYLFEHSCHLRRLLKGLLNYSNTVPKFVRYCLLPALLLLSQIGKQTWCWVSPLDCRIPDAKQQESQELRWPLPSVPKLPGKTWLNSHKLKKQCLARAHLYPFTWPLVQTSNAWMLAVHKLSSMWCKDQDFELAGILRISTVPSKPC